MDYVEALAALFIDAGITAHDLRRLRGIAVERWLEGATGGRGSEAIDQYIALTFPHETAFSSK